MNEYHHRIDVPTPGDWRTDEQRHADRQKDIRSLREPIVKPASISAMSADKPVATEQRHGTGSGEACTHASNNWAFTVSGRICGDCGANVPPPWMPTPPASPQPTVTLSDIDAIFVQDTILMALRWLRPYDYTSDVAKQTIERLNRVLTLFREKQV